MVGHGNEVNPFFIQRMRARFIREIIIALTLPSLLHGQLSSTNQRVSNGSTPGALAFCDVRSVLGVVEDATHLKPPSQATSRGSPSDTGILVWRPIPTRNDLLPLTFLPEVDGVAGVHTVHRPAQRMSFFEIFDGTVCEATPRIHPSGDDVLPDVGHEESHAAEMLVDATVQPARGMHMQALTRLGSFVSGLVSAFVSENEYSDLEDSQHESSQWMPSEDESQQMDWPEQFLDSLGDLACSPGPVPLID